MTFFEFASASPWLAFFLSLIALGMLKAVLTFCFLCVNRPLRHMNIRKHGWPPAHCDADGDFREPSERKTLTSNS